ncbi:murein biosynthesis integral membrane protein MurJ [Allonocardiopsis opalescens]|nr:murein biosynthesis integral membrane protein MurJ [Allonocardiopsis opalescens]
MRSSAVMALGTLASRLTGFARTVVFAVVLGTQLLNDAYTAANTIPFIIYDLLFGGLLASVIVPFLVKRRKLDADGGQATEQRLFTVTVVALFVLTAVAIAAAEWLIRMYAGSFTTNQHEVAVLLARFLLAQIFFVGLGGIAGAMLNVRERFGAPMWAPVLNNIITIATGLAFLLVAGIGATPDTVSDADVVLLGVGSTLGMVAQGLVLLPPLWKAGFRWRPRLDLRGSGLGEAVKTAGWMMVYLVSLQLNFLITSNVATRAGVESVTSGEAVGAGLTTYNYAYQLFQLPYAIIAVSVITALLPRMSGHASEGRNDLVRDDFSNGVRMSSVLLVPGAVALAIFAVPMCQLLFAYGSTSDADARNIGLVLTVFAIGLVPFSLFQLLLRVFYALGDTRTPALISFVNVVVHGAVAVASLLVLPSQQVVMGVAAGSMLSFVAGTVVAWIVLARRLGGLDGRTVLGSLLRMHLAAIPSAVFAVAMVLAFGVLPGVVLPSLLSLLVGGGIGMFLFVLFAKWLGVREVSSFLAMVRGRLLRRG